MLLSLMPDTCRLCNLAVDSSWDNIVNYVKAFPISYLFLTFLGKMFGATEFVNPKDYDKPIQQVRPHVGFHVVFVID